MCSSCIFIIIIIKKALAFLVRVFDNHNLYAPLYAVCIAAIAETHKGNNHKYV
jgi:hypothetical protein